MPFFDAIRIGASGAAADFEIERSLRFNSADTAYLNRTPSSASNRKTWTWSSWVKREQASGGTDRYFFMAGQTDGNDNVAHISFDSNDRLRLYGITGSFDYKIRTNSVFRDFSAWYHVVVAFDTTQATASNRVKFYVNGVQLTDLGQSDYPSQNHDSYFNNNQLHNIGRYNSGSTQWFQGYMAEINFIDGQALTPSSFAETDATTGQWNPIDTSGLTFGTNGFRLKFADNSGTTATTLGKDSSGNGNNFTPNNFSVSAGAANDSLEDTPTNNFATLNPLDIYGDGIAEQITNGNLEAKNTSSSYRVTGSTFYLTTGKWYYEVKVITEGSNFLVGVAGSDYAAGSGARRVYNKNGQKYGQSGFGNSYGASFTTNDIIGVAINLDDGELTFYKNGASQGVAFTDLLTGLVGSGWTPIFNGNSNSHAAFNFGQRAFDYTVPTGYKALNSANLPEPTILLPNKHFDTLLWSGNATTSDRSITGLNFQPDWTWTKTRNHGYHHVLFDAVRGPSNRLNSDQTFSENYTSGGNLASFDAPTSGNNDGGITWDYGTGNEWWNESGKNYISWNWNAGDTDGKTYTVTVVDDSGNKFRFDGFGTSAVTLDLAEGGTYIFNYPSAHPFRFSTTADGTHGGGSEYTTGVTHNSSTQVTIVVAASAPTLYYYCSSHSGMGGQVNTNSTLGSSNFDGSIQSTVKVNATAGFSIVSYAGNQSSAYTIGHGLGVAPKIILTKSRSSTVNWGVYYSILGTNTNYLTLNTSDAQGVNNNSEMSGVFAVLNSSTVQMSYTAFGDEGSSLIMYAFSEVAGYSKFGSYTGNGNADGTFVFTGFRVSWLMVKRTDTTGNWVIVDNKRDPFNVCDALVSADISDSEYDIDAEDFLSNGFKMRDTHSTRNGSGGTYIYLAFAESPFKNARAR